MISEQGGVFYHVHIFYLGFFSCFVTDTILSFWFFMQAYFGQYYPNGTGMPGMEEVVLKEFISSAGIDNKAQAYKAQVCGKKAFTGRHCDALLGMLLFANLPNIVPVQLWTTHTILFPTSVYLFLKPNINFRNEQVWGIGHVYVYVYVLDILSCSLPWNHTIFEHAKGRHQVKVVFSPAPMYK